MNSVERVVHYANEIEQEAPFEIPDHKPPVPWPSQGQVEIKDVVLKYRPEPPPVLKGWNLSLTQAFCVECSFRHLDVDQSWREDWYSGKVGRSRISKPPSNLFQNWCWKVVYHDG